MAEQFARALSIVPGAVLHGVTSRGRSRAEEFAARVTAAHAYRDYDELLQDPAVDIVYIATRNEHHHDDSIAALHSGKPVLCEKPFALTAAQGRAIATAARERKLFLMEAMWMRFSPAVRAVIELVRSNRIGPLTFLTAQLGIRVPFDKDHRVYAPAGGALYDLGVYPLSLVHALLGGAPARITSLANIGPTSVDEQFTATLDYPSGCQAVITSTLHSNLGNTATLYGTEGHIDLIGGIYFPHDYRVEMSATGSPANHRGRLSRAWSRVARRLPALHFEKETKRFSIREGYACEVSAVQRCLQAGFLECAEMSLDDSIEILELMDSIRRRWKEYPPRESCVSLS
jgi:predicted dehydrogenase